jgi:exoribonuclease R
MYTLETKDYLTFSIISEEGECINTIEGVEHIVPALPGDKVSETGELLKRTEHPSIVGILYLNSKVKYGITSKGKPIYLFEPFNKSYPLMIAGCGDKDTSSNVIALVSFEAWEKGSKFPRAGLQRILGPCGDHSVEREMLLLRYSPWPYPKKVEISQSYKDQLEKRPLIQGFTFNIDPPGCEDVDDIVSIEFLSGSMVILTISITDVATAIEDGSALDKYARKVGQSLYPDDQEPKHMLPPSISTKELSLVKGAYRNAISLSIKWSPEGIESTWWSCSKVTVDKAYTYKQAQEETRDEINVLKKIVNEIAGVERVTSEEWVESLMIYYNSEAGSLLKANGQGILRHHSEPDIKKLSMLELIDPRLGKMAYKSATYVPWNTPGKHWGLNIDDYAHASSPLRRYADLYNQRCLLTCLKNTCGTPQIPGGLCRTLNTLQKNSKGFERDEFFVNVLAKTKQPIVDGLIIEINTEKQFIKLWVTEWNRIVRMKTKLVLDFEKYWLEKKDGQTFPIKVNQEVKLSYHINYEKARWKDKIIFNIQPVA